MLFIKITSFSRVYKPKIFNPFQNKENVFNL